MTEPSHSSTALWAQLGGMMKLLLVLIAALTAAQIAWRVADGLPMAEAIGLTTNAIIVGVKEEFQDGSGLTDGVDFMTSGDMWPF